MAFAVLHYAEIIDLLIVEFGKNRLAVGVRAGNCGRKILERIAEKRIVLSVFEEEDIVFALLYWTGMARMVRGQILTVKQNEYILAARVSGAKDSRIIRRHILPNIVSVIIIAAALQIPSAIFTESFLSFIGLGVQAPMPSLGSLANEARA